MKTRKLNLHGVLPPMITPFKANGDLDLAAFQANIERLNEVPLVGYLVNGSNSEAAYLNSEEQLALVKQAKRSASPGKHLMAGTGCESLRETVRFTKACADEGAQSALVLTPNYYDPAMSSRVLINFFSKVADASPIPILIYNVPKFTHVNIKADAVEQLSKHENIVGMKDSTGDIPQLATFLRVADPDFQILVGTASAWYPALYMGVEASVMALANSHPAECCKVQALFDAGKLAEAKQLYQTLFPVNTAVTATYGIPGLKYACSQRGYQGGSVREPLLDLPETERAALDAILQAADEKLKKKGE